MSHGWIAETTIVNCCTVGVSRTRTFTSPSAEWKPSRVTDVPAVVRSYCSR